MTTPLISCIVPVYNGERYLAETLDSILAQTERSREVIVVDDGSTDGTPHVVAGYRSRVRYIRQQNLGPAAARNQGVTAATAAFVAFLDADDLWEPAKLACQHRRFLEKPELDLCFTRFQNFWMSELDREEKAFASHRLAQPITGYCIGTLLARRAAFDRFGLFDERLRSAENITWFLEAKARGAQIEILTEVLMRRRFHPTSLTRRAAPETLHGFLRAVKAWKDVKEDRLPPAQR